MIRDDVDVSSVDDLLGILEGTSGRTARLIDIPPVELAELRVSLRELADGATDLPSQEQLARLYDGLRRTAAAEDRSLLEISQGIGMAFVTSARTISDRHVKVPVPGGLGAAPRRGLRRLRPPRVTSVRRGRRLALRPRAPAATRNAS